jgi:hypothetical protein
MSASITGSSTSSSNRIEPHELSFGEMTTLSSGGIMSKQMKIDFRKQKGYCITCPHIPVLLLEIRRSRINPLWISKKPRTKDGECIDGRCLKCCPINDVLKGRRPTIASPPNFHSTSTQSLASSISSCSIGSLGSQQVTVIASEQVSIQHVAIKTSNHSSDARSIGQPHRERMLPPRPNRSYSGDSDSFRTLNPTTTRPTRRTPICRHVSTDDSVIRENSKFCLYPTDADSTVSHDEHRMTSHVMNQKSTEQQHPISNMFDTTNETMDDKSEKSYQQKLYPTRNNTLIAIQGMLSEMKAVPYIEIYVECLLSAMESNRNDLSVQIYCLKTIQNEFLEVGGSSTTSSLDNDWFTTNCTSKVLDAMTTCSSSIRVQDLGCDILLTLASQDCNRVTLIHQEACKSLHHVLDVHCRETSIVEKCFTTLRILSTEEDGRTCMDQLHLSTALVAAMQYNVSCASIQQDGCAILSNLSVNVLQNDVSIVSSDVISVVIDAMQVHNNDECVMASACFALKNFAYNPLNLRCMNRTSNILEALEDAALFPSLSISASQTSEKLYLSQAEDESLEHHASKVLMKSISKGCDNPEIVIIIIESLREYDWSRSHVPSV